jgi:MFS transporter
VIPSTYRQLLAIPDVRMPLLGALIGRLPIAALSLATILLVKEETGSFATAGAVEAAFAISAGIALPVQGRLIDRFGQTPVLLAAGATAPFALIAFVLAAQSGTGTEGLLGLAAIGGATIPPLSPALRTLWADLVPEERLRQSAFALDAVMLEVAFIAGPLMVAVLTATADPGVAILACAGLELAGTALFLISSASRRWRPTPREGGFAGPLASPGILVLLGSGLALGYSLGAMEIGLTAFATEEADSAAAGVLIAVQALASLLGGLWYGSREWDSPPAARYPLLCLLVALGFAPLILAPSFVGALPLAAVSGFALAPATAVAYLLVDLLAPPGTRAEASTWLLTTLVGGIAAGTATTGAIVTGADANWGFVAAFAGALAGWTVAVAGRSRLLPSPSASAHGNNRSPP